MVVLLYYTVLYIC